MSEVLEYNGYHGRRIIYSTEKEVTKDNILSILKTAVSEHQINQAQIRYLYNYYKGKQPIKQRKKEVRPEIVNNIVENTAYEIVSFKSSYLLGEPCTYVKRGDEQSSSTDELSMLNNFMFIRDKASQDKILADWIHIAGIAYRLVLPKRKEDNLQDDCPFIMSVLNPMRTFCVYSTSIPEKKLMGVTFTYNENNEQQFTVYTPTKIFKVEGVQVTEENNPLGMIPIFEYRANTALMGAFEPVIDLLDALNTIQSNRVDDVEQTVQAFLKFIGCDVTEKELQFMAENHVIKIPAGGDCDYVTVQLGQQETQTLVDYCYGRILTICGMPATQNGGASTSDTGVAVIYRDGWQQAEANASDTEIFFKKAEKEMLTAVLKLCKKYLNMDLQLENLDIKFTRRQYEASLTKAQALITMLQAGVSPKVAFPICGLFYDPTDAYEQSKELLEYKWGVNNEKRSSMSQLQQEITGDSQGQWNNSNKVSEM